VPTTLPVDAWRLVWHDEFNGSSLDRSKWAPEHSTYGDGNNELQHYRPENVSVGSGLLRIQARPEAYRGRDYTSGMLRTRNLASWTYGRFEISARLPRGQGLWPAFWMSPDDYSYGGWPASGEIDVFEVLGHEPDVVHGTVHWSEGRHRLSSGAVRTGGFDTSEGFHTYAVEWEPGEIRWYLDGQLYHLSRGWSAPGGGAGAPFDQSFYLKLNLAVGGNWPGAPDASTPWPADMYVDWVRVFQR